MTADQFANEIVALLPALRAFARTFHRTQTDADDLVQETVVRALANIDRFQPGTRLKSWLFTIMRNTFCTRYRVASREAVGIVECVSLAGSVPPDQEWRLRGQELETACGNLPEKYRTAFEFIILNGRSYEDAATYFGCPVGTIKSRVNRARHHLMNELA